MDDLISRQAAIDEMWKIRRQQQMLDDTRKADLVMHGIYLAEKALKQLPSVQQWIPRSEPPKSDGFYIVYAPYYTGGSSTAKEHHDGVMFSKYKKGKWSIEHGYYNRDECVKAWMPLPLPWKGES